MTDKNTPPEETRPANQKTEVALDGATCSADWFLAGWLRALRVPPAMYPRHAAERIPIRHRIATKRKIELLQCDNCGGSGVSQHNA